MKVKYYYFMCQHSSIIYIAFNLSRCSKKVLDVPFKWPPGKK